MKNDKRREEQLRAFQIKLGYEFKNLELLTEALTHSSYANENGAAYNERLEFLGDAVLELITSARLFAAYPNFSEGELTRLRARLVCKNSLNDWASESGLKPLDTSRQKHKNPYRFYGRRQRRSSLRRCLQRRRLRSRARRNIALPRHKRRSRRARHGKRPEGQSFRSFCRAKAKPRPSTSL